MGSSSIDVQPKEALSMPDVSTEAAPSFNFNEASVLIVDENHGFMDIATQMLSGFGFRTFHRCSRLSEGQTFARDHETDLVLVDPFPAANDGLTLIRELRQRQEPGAPHRVVIVMTGHTPLDLIKRAREVGADYVVAKPFSPATLLERILWSSGSQMETTNQPDHRDALREAAMALLQ
jgi:CheY-like chemotaxis protein